MAVRYRGRREGWAPLFVRDDPIAKDLYLRTHAFCRAMQERANAAETEAATVKSLLAATQERLAQIERDEDHRKTLAR